MLIFSELISEEYENCIYEMRDTCHFPAPWGDEFFRFIDLVDKISFKYYDEIDSLIKETQLEEYEYEKLAHICNQIEKYVNNVGETRVNGISR